MIDHRPILLVIGILLATLGCAMMIPALLEVALEQDGWVVFAASSVLTLFFGIAMAIASRGKTGNLSLREAFLLTTFSWVFLAAFGAIPFAWSNLGLSYTDAFFESMSGLTTTGATVIVGLDTAPRGLILWRALLQWLGGIGIIVMAIAVLPMLQIGGMQLFKVEAFDAPEKILPRATQISGSLSSIYLIFTVACAFGYFIAGMNYFDAIVHSMTTIATGGYSAYDSSFQKFNDAGIESVAIIGMILGSIPFLLYLKGFRLGPLELLKDEQVRGFLIALGFFILLLAIQQTLTSKFGFFYKFAALGFQCNLPDDRNRLCFDRLQQVGKFCDRARVSGYVCRRVQRIHVLRHQDISFPSDVLRSPAPHKNTHLSERYVCHQL